MNALRTIIVIGVSALLLLVAGPPMFANPPSLYTGIGLLNPAAASWSTIVRVDRGSPAYRAGLRTGDTVACLSVRDHLTIEPFYPPFQRFTGNPIRLCALHDGVWHAITFVPQRMPPPGLLYGTLLMAALRLAVFAIFLFVGCVLVMTRPSPMMWLLFVYCAANLPWSTAMGMYLWVPSALYTLLNAVALTLGWTGAAVLALFTLAVPDNAPPRGWRSVAFRAVAVATILQAGDVLFATLDTSVFIAQTWTWIIEAFSVLTVVFAVARLASMNRGERARFGWAAFAIIFGVACGATRFIQGNNDLATVAGFLTVVMPLCLMYAILRRHVIDVRFVLSRTVVYGVVTTLVIGIIGLVDWATSAYLSEMRAALAIDAVVTITLGVLLHRCYRWVEVAVDAVLFRRKHDAEAYLKRLARTLLRADLEDTVDRALAHDPYDKLDLTMAALFRSRGSGYAPSCAAGWNAPQTLALEHEHDLVRFLNTERARLAIADLRTHVSATFTQSGALPVVAIPIFRGDELFAFTLYGLHRDGTQLDPDELEVLERLCEMAAQAYMRIENVRYHALLENPLPA